MQDEKMTENLDELSKDELINLVKQLRNQKRGIKRKLEKLTHNSNSEPKRKKQKKQKKRKFDISRHNRRHIALKVAYIGWDYHGFASQKNTENTVEGKVFAALRKTCLIGEDETARDVNYSRCGRTDKGVSAFCQVIGLYLRSNLSEGVGVVPCRRTLDDHPSPKKKNQDNEEEKDPDKDKNITELDYCMMLNRVLPDDIRVTSWCPVGPDFSARFACLYRTYKYFFVKRDHNINKMKKAAKYFEGKHDYRNFCKLDFENVSNFERGVHHADIRKSEYFSGPANQEKFDVYEFIVCGQAFLWHQVRNMMSVLFMVGQGLEEPEIVQQMLDLSIFERKPQYLMASEEPLVLYDCGYEDLDWQVSLESHRRVMEHFYNQWNSYAMRCTMINAFRQSLETFLVTNIDNKTNDEYVEFKDIQDKVFSSVKIDSKKHQQLSQRETEGTYEEKMAKIKN
eukprot:gb/GECH01007579.1/.p1 GENE.gb/GECH01007579.1/~~gb/GECH01007579.1/.p1  ORF type:complete len:453 (+),score=101.15 gb/GECH01007579.1/:1-1359(+)